MQLSRFHPSHRSFDILSRLCFALTIVLIPFRWRVELLSRPIAPLYSDYTDFLLFASDALVIATLAFWAGSLLLKPRKIQAGAPFMWILLAGLTIAGWVSVIGSVDPILSRYQAVHLLVLLFFYLYIVNQIDSPGWVVVPVMVQIALQSMIAILQVVSQSSLGLQVLGELKLDPAQTGVSVVFGDGIRFLRAYGLSDHPNILGGCIAFGLVIVLAVILYGHACRERIVASFVFVFSLLALVMTFSRSAWLSLVVAGSFMVGLEAVLHRWDSVKRMAVLGAISALVIAPIIIQNLSLFRSRVNSGNMAQDPQIEERSYLMQAGNQIFVEHSLIGVGLGASPLAMKIKYPDFRINYQPPHYTILDAALETGVIGGAFYLLLLISPLIVFTTNWKTFSNQPLMIGSFALLLAITVVGFFDYYTWQNPSGRLWQWLAWGLYSAALNKTL